MCGNWLHSGVYPEAGNLAQRRSTADPSGLGMFHGWTFSWPANRRVMYNRASADGEGRPWDAARVGIQWNGERWVGDVPDMKPDAPPGTYGAFVMLPEGVGRLSPPASTTARCRSTAPIPPHSCAMPPIAWRRTRSSTGIRGSSATSRRRQRRSASSPISSERR